MALLGMKLDTENIFLVNAGDKRVAILGATKNVLIFALDVVAVHKVISWIVYSLK